jgi:hypothetical protein
MVAQRLEAEFKALRLKKQADRWEFQPSPKKMDEAARPPCNPAG